MSEQALTQIERDVFIGFYSIRKLMDKPGALTDATRVSTWQCNVYPNKDRVNVLNNHRIDELFDMSSRQQETKCLGFLCNQVIHSFIFCTYLDEHYAFDGVLFASDRDKDVKLYRVSAAALIEIFFRVGKDYPSQVHFHRDLASGAVTTTSV